MAFVPGHSRAAVLNQAALALLLGPEPAHAGPEAVAARERLWALGLCADSPTAQAPADEPLSVWLHLTNACNLACSYCYIAKSAEAMSREVARAAVDAACRSALRHGYRSLALKYAGGEPTLALDLLVETQRYAEERAAALGLGLSAGVLTNGAALSPERVERLRELGLPLTVSLDGLGEAHDAQRPRRGGQGSAERVRAGIEAALAAGLDLTAAITVTAHSAAGLPDLIGWLLERDIPFTISFARPPAQAPARVEAEEQAIVAGMRAAFERIAEAPPRWSLLGGLLDRADLSQSHQRPCAAGESYLVVDQAGRVSKCQMLIGQPVGDLAAADPLGLIRGGIPLYQSVDQRAGCRECEWRHWCAGGCPVASMRAGASYGDRPPNCPIYLSLFPQLLRLEGLRLLHWRERAGVVS